MENGQAENNRNRVVSGQRLALNKQVQSYFDIRSNNWANYYDRQHGSTFAHLDLTARLAAATQMLTAESAELGKSITLLDAGCGTGEGAGRLSTTPFNVFSVDLALAMVKRAVQQYDHIRGCAADATALPFPSAAFDIVLSLGTLEYVPVFKQAVREFRRVLKPGGALILSVPNRASWFRRIHKVERLVTRPLRALRANFLDIGKEEAGLTSAYHHQSWTLPEIKLLLEAHEFKLVEFQLMTYGWRLPLAETWPLNLAFCRWMNAHCDSTGVVARQLACTIVLRASAV